MKSATKKAAPEENGCSAKKKKLVGAPTPKRGCKQVMTQGPRRFRGTFSFCRDLHSADSLSTSSNFSLPNMARKRLAMARRADVLSPCHHAGGAIYSAGVDRTERTANRSASTQRPTVSAARVSRQCRG